MDNGEIGQEKAADCLAWARQEPPREACCWICAMRVVFAEVWRVMRPEATLWLNVGDAYVHGTPGGGSVFSNGRTDGRIFYEGDKPGGRVKHSTLQGGLKPKNLLGLPWRLALALQADGWILRSEIIWHKLNPMPESTTDRPSRAHEQVFMFSKQGRYYYDSEAVKEVATMVPQARHVPRDLVCGKDAHRAVHRRPQYTLRALPAQENATRNLRTVWAINPEPFSGNHFATFPTELVRRCLRAGAPPGGIIFDPFAGSGTVGLVARELGHDAVCLDLSYPYLHDIARERLGLAALTRWTEGAAPRPETHTDLPLFATLDTRA